MRTPHVREISIVTIQREYGSGPGRHWFDADALRFFRSRPASYGFRGPGGTFFVSSERPPRGRRAYTVRQLVGPGDIDTASPFCEMGRGAAWGLARRLAAGKAEAK